MKTLKNIFANLFGGKPKQENDNKRLQKLEKTLQYIFNEIAAAMDKEPRVAMINDDELILQCAQILMEIRIGKELQKQPTQNIPKQPPLVSQKKVRTYH